VHWIGAGLSTGSGLRVVDEAAEHTTVWARDPYKARGRLETMGLRNDVRPIRDLSRAIGPGDVVVCMAPATEHARWLSESVQAGAHFACPSYTSAELAGIAEEAKQTAVLTEAGLDPGLDQLLARVLVADARDKVGDGPARAWFHSDCGGLPARTNQLRHEFSWTPRGVLHALRKPARYIDNGEVRQTSVPWEHTRCRRLFDGGETFEIYPNRDSLPFQQRYGFPWQWHNQEFRRGTVRLNGWRQAWAPVFEVLRSGDDDRIDALADHLAARYPTDTTGRDRVVLVVNLQVDDWSGGYLLDLRGDQQGSAMARCVSLPLAVGVEDILAGRAPAGLSRAAENAVTARRWLTRLAALSVPVTKYGT
jgi:saccharopine dehydrogenase-like protein